MVLRSLSLDSEGSGGIRPEQSGGGEIRTHGTLSSTLAFQASTLSHSVTPPLYTG